MKAQLFGLLGKLFPVQPHEWSKATMLLVAAAFIGMGGSMSRVAAEGLFLTRFGVEYYPYLQLVNPFLVLFATAVYGTFASSVSSDRMMIYTALAPLPLIVALRILMGFEVAWVYFVLFAFVLAYASVLATSWAVYLPGHYDVQEAKRLLPFINSGLLIGGVAGGLVVAVFVPVIGAANVILLWLGALIGIMAVVRTVGKLFTAMRADTRKTTAPSQRSVAKTSSMVDNLKEGVAYSRSSALFMTTAIATIATMMALQIIDFEYSKIFARAYPDTAQLTSFLGIVDGLTTILALLIQWFVVPRCIRSMGVQGTNLIFPSLLTSCFAGMIAAPILITGIFSRFTRSSLQPSLRGTTRTLIFNAVPRKTGALVRSINTGIVLPVGQIAGALLLVSLKGLGIPILFPVLGFLISALYVVYSHLQNKAYGKALLDLLKEDKVHLLNLGDDELKRLDATAVAAISERLRPLQATSLSAFPAEDDLSEQAAAQEETTLAAIELLRTVGSKPAFEALCRHLPYDSPRLTAATLEALATIGGDGAVETLRPYVDDAAQAVRLAAIDGLRHLGDTALLQRMRLALDDADMQVRARALSVVLSQPHGEDTERANQLWETMLKADDKDTLIAALSVFADVPDTPLQGRLYRALDHDDPDISRAALAALHELARHGRIQLIDSALLHRLEDPDVELRQQTLQVLAAIGTDEALHHMLVLLDDEQPSVQEALAEAIKPFGKRAVEPLMACLQSPQRLFRAKESALLTLGRLDGVQADQFLTFWESELRELYRDKLRLDRLEGEPGETLQGADEFLRVALEDAYERRLSLLLQLLAVWSSPEVARLVASGLQDEDRSRRAQALEALESLSERHFTRLFLPILEADREPHAWRDLAQRQWSLTYASVDEVLADCGKSRDKWIYIGAMLSEQGRTAADSGERQERLRALARNAENDKDVQETARRLLQPAHDDSGLALTEVLLFLKRVPLFAKMTLAQLRAIAGQLVERRFRSAESIFDEGDVSRDLYLIVNGQVDIVQQRGETLQTLVTLKAGDYFGDMAIFEELPRSAGAVAASDARLLTLSPEGFRQTITQEPEISFEIFRELSARLRRIDDLQRVPQT